MSKHRLIKTHRLILQNKSKWPLQQTKGETVLPFILHINREDINDVTSHPQVTDDMGFFFYQMWSAA